MSSWGSSLLLFLVQGDIPVVLASTGFSLPPGIPADMFTHHFKSSLRRGLPGKVRIEGCVGEAEVQDPTPALKATPPNQSQSSYHNLVLVFLTLTGTEERHYGMLSIFYGCYSVRIIGTWKGPGEVLGCLNTGYLVGAGSGRQEQITTGLLRGKSLPVMA